MKTWRFLLCGALVSGLAGIACGARVAADSPFLGEWKLITDFRLDQANLTLTSDGSCLLQEEARTFHYCRWNTGRDGQATFHYGLFLPMNTATARVADDEMTLDFGDSGATRWVLTKAGSQKDQDFAAYFKGEKLIDSGDYPNGIAQWTLAAEHGHAGAQNSLAWLYATTKVPELRDGTKAVAYAEKATATLRHFLYLDTYAAALARDNQFERAAKAEEEALALLTNDESWPDREAALGRFRERLALYRSGQAYTEP